MIGSQGLVLAVFIVTTSFARVNTDDCEYSINYVKYFSEYNFGNNFIFSDQYAFLIITLISVALVNGVYNITFP